MNICSIPPNMDFGLYDSKKMYFTSVVSDAAKSCEDMVSFGIHTIAGEILSGTTLGCADTKADLFPFEQEIIIGIII